MSSIPVTSPARSKEEPCLEIPEFRRLRYFFGQMLDDKDFQLEQEYFRDKFKLHNRCLHGYGTICGLIVEPVRIPRECLSEEEEEERKLLEELKDLLAAKEAGTTSAEPPSPAVPDPGERIEELRRRLGEFYEKHCAEEPHTCVRITCGVALDCHGNELIVRKPLKIDLLQWLSADDFKRVKQGARTLYISLCYCEQPYHGVRPLLQSTCGATPDCCYGRTKEGVRVRVTVDPPEDDCRCEGCCESCEDCCLLLARIEGFWQGLPLFEHQIDNHVRRNLNVLQQPTVITGVSWKNGHHYTQEEAKRLMGTVHEEHREERHREYGEHREHEEHPEHHPRGLEIRFSRPVRASTIRPGVMDTWVIEGGRGRSANIYHKQGEFVDKPKDGFVRRIIYRDVTRETLEPGDRVLVMLRTEFILDECCRPVNGFNVGGRVPVLPEFARLFHIHEHEHEHHEECHIPPYGYGPWTSGLGVPCGGFQGWFFIREDEREHGRDRERNR